MSPTHAKTHRPVRPSRTLPFLVVYVTVYGAMHGYLGSSLLQQFPLGPWGSLGLLAWCAAQTAGPIVLRVLEDRGWRRTPAALALAVYPWMGYLLLGCTALATLDALRLVAATASTVWERSPYGALSGPAATTLALGAAGLAAIYGWFEAWHVRIRQVELVTDRLPREAGPLRLVQITDVHVGFLVGPRRIRKLAREIRRTRPDLLVCTGDFVDSAVGYDPRVEPPLRQAIQEIPLGALAVLGNHEVYMGTDASVGFLRACGFRVLRNETVRLGPHLAITGLDDPVLGPPPPLPRPPGFSVLLKHRPDLAGNPFAADLQVSGHSHGGQIWPFRALVDRHYPLPDGLSALAPGCWLYKSKGTGSWGPPLRFLAPPEISVIVLYPA